MPNARGRGPLTDDTAMGSVLRAMRRRIEDGLYAEGGRLPPERDLAIELRVSRSTIRKAMRVLETEGLIWRHVGRGTFAGHPPSREVTGDMKSIFLASPREIVEARLAMEPIIAGYAAHSASREDIAFLYKCSERLETARDWPTFEIWDRAFHRGIAVATQNKVFVAFLEMVNVLRENETWVNTQLPAIQSEKQRSNTARHRLIARALEETDMHRAMREMRRHLELVRELYIDLPTDASSDLARTTRQANAAE